MKRFVFVLLILGLAACTQEKATLEQKEVSEKELPCFHCIELLSKQLQSCAACMEELPQEAIAFEGDHWQLVAGFGQIDTIFHQTDRRACFVLKSNWRMDWKWLVGALADCMDIEEEWNPDMYPQGSPEYLGLLGDCVGL